MTARVIEVLDELARCHTRHHKLARRTAKLDRELAALLAAGEPLPAPSAPVQDAPVSDLARARAKRALRRQGIPT